MSHVAPAAPLTPSVALLLEQLTPSLPAGVSALDRLHVVFGWLQELLACAVLQPAALHNAPSSSPVAASAPLPAASPSSSIAQPPRLFPPHLALADSPVKRSTPASSPAAASSILRSHLPPSPAPSASPSRVCAAADASRARSSSQSARRGSGVSASVESEPSCAPVVQLADVRFMCELLQLCYIDALARPHSATATAAAFAAQKAAVSSDGRAYGDVSVPPSAASLSFCAFLASHSHFASTSSFRSLLADFVRRCGVVFLLHCAERLTCLPRALSFIASHALPHVSSACVAFLVTRDHCPLLFTSAAGSHILRTLSSGQQLELLITTLLAPHTAAAAPAASAADTSTSASTPLVVLSHLWELLPSLDSHSLYRLCTLLDPASNAVNPATVDSHTRIVMCEVFLHALCRIRYKAEQSDSGQQQQQRAEEGAQEEEEEEDEELSFYTSHSLHAALLAHRPSYRVWLILALLNDLHLYEAAAALHESAEQWADAFEARLRHVARAHQRCGSGHTSSHDADEQGRRTAAALLGLLHSHVARVAAGPEQARLLALLIQLWRECALPAAELEARFIADIDELADSLCILAFAAQPSHEPTAAPAFSPLLLLHLTGHRLQLLRQSHTAAAGASLGGHTASPRVWHDLRQRLHGKVGRRQMAEVGGVREMTQLSDYSRDAVTAFTCQHAHYAFDMAERCLPQVVISANTQRQAQQQQQLVGAVTKQYERAQRDGGVVRLACPECVAAALTAH